MKQITIFLIPKREYQLHYYSHVCIQTTLCNTTRFFMASNKKWLFLKEKVNTLFKNVRSQNHKKIGEPRTQEGLNPEDAGLWEPEPHSRNDTVSVCHWWVCHACLCSWTSQCPQDHLQTWALGTQITIAPFSRVSCSRFIVSGKRLGL